MGADDEKVDVEEEGVAFGVPSPPPILVPQLKQKFAGKGTSAEHPGHAAAAAAAAAAADPDTDADAEPAGAADDAVTVPCEGVLRAGDAPFFAAAVAGAPEPTCCCCCCCCCCMADDEADVAGVACAFSPRGIDDDEEEEEG